ncbi:MAG: hypothetical protein ABR506_05300 [Candidatus Krumholzibacteriia bacterium]
MTKPTIAIAAVLAVLLAAAVAHADTAALARASWLLERADGAGPLDARLFQGEIGAVRGTGDGAVGAGGDRAGLKILASAVLPGAGEALSGYRRGYLMMAADIFAWTQVAKYHGDGKDFSDAYYAFADAHYTDAKLWKAYASSLNPGDPDYNELFGEGPYYFPGIADMNDVSDLDNLSLYVSKEDDRREYYENLGKWDQFIFGWDDYLNPRAHADEYGYTPADPTNAISDLRQPWVSKNREIYRDMRAAANDAYNKRDRWLYVNIGLRVFSVLQTAWLNGLLGGGDDSLAILGHEVQVAATPAGPYAGRVHAALSF